jgi:mRNA interferase RelE/StbE
MPFDLAFHPQALRSKLRGSTNRHKIKLRAAGFRLIDELLDQQMLVLAIGKLERNATYLHADQR